MIPSAAPNPFDNVAYEVALIPLDGIEEDPNQPRKTFHEQALEELARDIELVAAARSSQTPWIDGLLHPISVYDNPAYTEESDLPPYRIYTGARRLRAYQLRGWPVIPARILEAPRSLVLRTRTQIGENRSRESTSLFEDASAIARAFTAWKAEHRGGKAQDFARLFDRSPAWLSQQLAVARAEGFARQALEEQRIGNFEAFRLFLQLAVELQSQMLARARRLGELITVSLLRQAMQTAPKSRKRASERQKRLDAAVAVGELPNDEPALLLRLRPRDLRLILLRLEEPIPEAEAELEAALGRALSRANLEAA